ncbi:AAA family ATPase [Candidatus Woesearchaeota archaeon]|nr:AAA family ATPase [Candidatus Woesearchaeota archaeon]
MSKEKNPFDNIVNLPATTYKNTTPVLKLGGVDLYLWDVVKASLAARLNIGLGGGAGGGKSQLFADVQGLFGNNASYVLGRNDLDIKALFRQLNFGKLREAMDKGGTVSQKDLAQITSDIYRPLIVVEEINRCAEIVQNQLFNIFEGFIEIDGVKYFLGHGETQSFKDFDGKEFKKNSRYSVGVWSANFGNGQYTGTVTMDKALKERSHMIIDVDNFYPGVTNALDLDGILLENGGEVRLKDVDTPQDQTKHFIDAFNYIKQKSYTPNPKELGKEMLLFRYLTLGLDYIPVMDGKNSKRIMKETWPNKAEEDNIGTSDNDKLMYGIVSPASVRSGMTVIALARSLREYAKAKDPKADPSVIDSVVESFKLVAPYGGMIDNPQIIKEKFVGNNYLAAEKIGGIIKTRLQEKSDLIQAIADKKSKGEPYTQAMIDDCVGEYACFR